jgi:hypothetical protein
MIVGKTMMLISAHKLRSILIGLFAKPVPRANFPTMARRGDFHSAIPRFESWRPAFETQQAEFSINNLTGEPMSATPWHFVPSGKEVAHALIDVAVDTAGDRPARSIGEVHPQSRTCGRGAGRGRAAGDTIALQDG